MTKDEFIRPYLLLVYQPWGKRYGLILPEGQVQCELYYSHLKGFAAPAWETVCEKIATTFDHWPSVNEIKLMIQPIQPPTRPALPSAEDSAPEDYPPRLAYEYSKRHNITLAEAWKKFIPGWLRDHPHHPEHERVAEMLARISAVPQNLGRSMPTYQEDSPRREFVTDIQATGTPALKCKRCGEERELFSCWCWEKTGIEACKACLAEHMPNCKVGSIVNSI